MKDFKKLVKYIKNQEALFLYKNEKEFLKLEKNNPKKKYYNWSHTIIDDKEVLEDELNYGYNTEEFIIEKSDKGEWILNIESYSIEDNSNPTYIKYTVYKNYGRPNEIRKVELLDLSKLKQKVTLDVLKYYN